MDEKDSISEKPDDGSEAFRDDPGTSDRECELKIDSEIGSEQRDDALQNHVDDVNTEDSVSVKSDIDKKDGVDSEDNECQDKTSNGMSIIV